MRVIEEAFHLRMGMRVCRRCDATASTSTGVEMSEMRPNQQRRIAEMGTSGDRTLRQR
jgi:hypothetical protein